MNFKLARHSLPLKQDCVCCCPAWTCSVLFCPAGSALLCFAAQANFVLLRNSKVIKLHTAQTTGRQKIGAWHSTTHCCMCVGFGQTKVKCCKRCAAKGKRGPDRSNWQHVDSIPSRPRAPCPCPSQGKVIVMMIVDLQFLEFLAPGGSDGGNRDRRKGRESCSLCGLV